MNSLRLSVFALAALVLPNLCHADTTYFLFTGHTDAQTQIDINHSSVWYNPLGGQESPTITNAEFLVTSFDATFDWNLGGAHLTIKDGSHSSLGVTLSLYECTVLCDQPGLPSYTLADSVFVADSSFTQQFSVVDFDFTTPFHIVNGNSYYATVTSTEVDTQNKAYFIKGANNLTITDITQTETLLGSDPVVTPEPGTWVLMASGLGLALASRLRRRQRIESNSCAQ